MSLDPKFKHPWTNGQVEIFNKTIKNATTKTYHYETVDELKQHLMSYLLYYNHQKKLKALKFKTPYIILLEKFDSSPELFKDNPYLKFRGLNRLFVSAKYAKEYKDFLDSMQQSQKQATLEKFKPFLGKLKPEERFAGLEGKELLIEVAKAKCESWAVVFWIRILF